MGIHVPMQAASRPQQRFFIYKTIMKEKKLYGIVYRARNIINNKVYIGQTIRNLSERRRSHELSINWKSHKTYFRSALVKYGKNNFKWKIIDTACSRNELDRKEYYWINKYKSNIKKYGYNLKEGGGSTEKYSKESKKKMSLSHIGLDNHQTGRKHTKKELIKMSENRKGVKESKIWRENIGKGNKGKIRTSEHIEKYRKAKSFVSKETREKLRQCNLGKHPTDETILKISNTKKGIPWTQARWDAENKRKKK
jgi:group I intron endonuclease